MSMTTFQLWDIESANLIGSYADQESALAIVRHALDLHGAETVSGLSLLRQDDRGRLIKVAEGEELVHLAADTVEVDEQVALPGHGNKVTRRRAS